MSPLWLIVSRRVYEFGDFRLDRGRRLLVRRDGAPVQLASKAFDTLSYLVEHAGTVLGKDELMQAVWPDTAVEENNLNQHISLLRRLLGEARGEHRYIATVPSRGYSSSPRSVRQRSRSPSATRPPKRRSWCSRS